MKNKKLTMKHIYSVLVIALVFISCKDKEKTVVDRTKSDWEFYKLKGEVKTISEKTEITDKTAINSTDGYDTDFTFNESGMLISEKKYLPGNKIFQETTYKGKDKTIKLIQYLNGAPSIITDYAWDTNFANNLSVTKRNPDNSQLDRVGMKYKNGKVTERTVYSRQDLPIEKTTYEYDSKGNLITENFYLDKDAVQIKNIYEYNGPNKISEVKLRADGSMIYKTFYEYNTANKLVKSGTTDSNGKVQYAQDITYDKNNNVLTYTSTEGTDTQTTDKFNYDANNNKTLWVNLVNNKEIFKADYKYDKNNNLIAVNSTDTQNAMNISNTYSYEYDKKGNWIKKTTTINSKPAFTTTRTITYF